MATNVDTSEKTVHNRKRELWDTMLPELLTREELAERLLEKNVSVERMDKPQLLELYRRMVMPLPQRKFWQTRSKKDTQTRIKENGFNSVDLKTHQVPSLKPEEPNGDPVKDHDDTANPKPSKVRLVKNGPIKVDGKRVSSPFRAEVEPILKRPRQEIAWP